jgi:hypothetical protein
VWATDITDELSVAVVVQYLRLWTAIAQVPQSGTGRINSARSGAATDNFPLNPLIVCSGMVRAGCEGQRWFGIPSRPCNISYMRG